MSSGPNNKANPEALSNPSSVTSKTTMESNMSGKQRRRERNKTIRQIGTHNKTDNSLTENIPRVTGPIEADRYALARITEINEMQSAIKRASYALNELAFQSLPRGLRRRAASHNINRLPARLRAKAAKEAYSSAPNTPLTRKKVKKIKTPRNTVEEYLRRQKSKKWLETHIWHTKRMKMNDIWGYRIAARPNTKSARVTYRSFTRLSIVHDASYMACIELQGDKDEIIRVMNTMTDAGLPSVGSERYISGKRVGYTYLYEYLGYPSKLICPFSFLWKPKTTDTIWLWIHPSAVHEAVVYLKRAIKEMNASHVQLNDLRNEILRFELAGPRSTALLQAILDPVPDEDIKGNNIWKDLRSLRSSCSISPGSVIGLVVQDPRLRFPQKVLPRTNTVSNEDQKKIQKILDQWPSDAAETTIWNKELRQSLFDNKISEYGLNLRREKNLIPGTKLDATPEDSRIPLLLIQRGYPVYGTQSAQPLCSHEFVEGWSLIIPRGFGMSFWKSLIFAGARVAGYKDVRAMHFESGRHCFPQDYPGTRAFEIHRKTIQKTAEAIWQKRPPAKRVNYVKRGVEYPFECAFETLSSSDRMDIEEQDGQMAIARPSYSLVSGERLLSTLLSSSSKTADYQSILETLVHQRGLDRLQLPTDLQMDDLLVKIRVKYIDRGKPLENAMIYTLEDNEEYNYYTSYIRQKTSPLKKSKRKIKELLELDDLDKSFELPSKLQQIGYITNGNFSLTLGYGFGLGACTVSGLRKLKSIDELQKRSIKMIVLVRNASSLKARPAQLEVIF
ncbi:MAG: ribonucleases P/MRP protein subunit POP1-domain-containing protein [Benjaminiella poitrasii]|nr:MAG: ribonucleases P/MRP protein subunit POP1-domain-containing protein [Benjaminiella poitrasii]